MTKAMSSGIPAIVAIKSAKVKTFLWISWPFGSIEAVKDISWLFTN